MSAGDGLMHTGLRPSCSEAIMRPADEHSEKEMTGITMHD
jgi:hypothetical protein